MAATVDVTTCTRATTRCADAREYEHALRPCCRAHVVHVTRSVVEALDEAGIAYWADYGTILGAVRNPLTAPADYPWLAGEEFSLAPGIVPHDKDADIGVRIEDWAKSLATLRALAFHEGFDLVIRAHRGSAKVRLSRSNHTNLDIFFWYTRPDGTMYRRMYCRVDTMKGREFHRDLLFPLGTVEWEGLTLTAPRDPAAFCEMRYGPDWRTPVCANNDGVVR